MLATQIESIVIMLLQIFLRNNPTAEELEVILPAIIGAFTSAKSGQPFSVSVPVSVDGVKGNFDVAWAPVAPSSSVVSAPSA